MKTINEPNFQAVFVNTNDHPKRVVKHPYFQVLVHDENEKSVFQLQTWFYEHPDSDGQAVVNLMVWKRIPVAKNSIPAFEAMCKGMEGLTGLIL